MCSFLLRPLYAVADVGGGGGIRTPVGLHPNGFQDRLVVTASIRLHIFNCKILQQTHNSRTLDTHRYRSDRFARLRIAQPSCELCTKYASIYSIAHTLYQLGAFVSISFEKYLLPKNYLFICINPCIMTSENAVR